MTGLFVGCEASGPRIDINTWVVPGVAEVHGLDEATLATIAAWPIHDERWKQTLAVYVRPGLFEPIHRPGVPAPPTDVGPQPLTTPMIGRYSVVDGVLRFEPRFGWEKDRAYEAVYTPPPLADGSPPIGQRLTTLTHLSEDNPPPPARVVAIHPSSDRLPENLLRIYVTFAPHVQMRMGDVYRYLHLYDESGRKIDQPFLELPEVLWDTYGDRLTILFDPGRVKQGLKPREVAGPVLVAGKRYTFVIDADWPDGLGRPLGKRVSKTFTATKADTAQPDPNQWKIKTPRAGTREPLTIDFLESLDYWILLGAIDIEGLPDGFDWGRSVKHSEHTWEATPTQPWPAGRYELIVDTSLEDPSGNSIARPFEVDLEKPDQPDKVAKFIRIPIVIESKP